MHDICDVGIAEEWSDTDADVARKKFLGAWTHAHRIGNLTMVGARAVEWATPRKRTLLKDLAIGIDRLSTIDQTRRHAFGLQRYDKLCGLFGRLSRQMPTPRACRSRSGSDGASGRSRSANPSRSVRRTCSTRSRIVSSFASWQPRIAPAISVMRRFSPRKGSPPTRSRIPPLWIGNCPP